MNLCDNDFNNLRHILMLGSFNNLILVDCVISQILMSKKLGIFIENSRLETLDMTRKNGSSYRNLLDVLSRLPKVPSLKKLVLDGQSSINKRGVFDAISRSSIEDLSIKRMGISDRHTKYLLKLFSSSSLKRVDLSANIGLSRSTLELLWNVTHSRDIIIKY